MIHLKNINTLIIINFVIGLLSLLQARADELSRTDKLRVLYSNQFAFDRRGNRLGRGAGYYDRFLRRLPEAIPTIGLAFKFQILKNLPHNKNTDIPVTKVICA